MTTITFAPTTQNQSVYWGDDAIWSPMVVPNGADDNVVVPVINRNQSPYSYDISIASGDNYAIRGLDLQSDNLLVYGELSVSGDLNASSNIEINGGALKVSGDLNASSNINMHGGLLSAGSFEAQSDLLSYGTLTITGSLTVNTQIVSNGLTINAGSLTNNGVLNANSGNLTVNVGSGGFVNLAAGVLSGGTYQIGYWNKFAVSYSNLYVNDGQVVTVDAADIDLEAGNIAFFDAATQQYETLQSTLTTIAPTGMLKVGAFEFAQFGNLQNDGEIFLNYNSNFAPSGLAIGGSGVLVGTGALKTATINDGTIDAVASVSLYNGISVPADLVIDAPVTGRGNFEIDGALNSGGGYFGATLELASVQSENVVFAEGAGTLLLDAPESFTGNIVVSSFLTGVSAAGAPFISSFDVDLSGLAYSSVTGHSYIGDPQGGVLSIETTSGSYSLNFVGNLQASDFTLSAGSQTLSTSPPILDVTVAPSAPRPVTITGTVADQTTLSETPVDPFSTVTINDPNSGATDTLTITVGGAGGTLSGSGLAGGTGGVFTLAGTAAAITSELDALSFRPRAGQPGSTSTSTFALSDLSSAYSTPTFDTTTSVIDTDPAIAPQITGTVAGQTTTSETPVAPFSGVTINDPNSGATDTVTITVGGAGGTLSGSGLTGGTGGAYTLIGTAAAITSELDALSFTPRAGQPGSTSTSTFTLSDLSSAAATPAVDTTTSVIDTDAPVDWSITHSLTGPAGQIYALYKGLLGRAPDPFGYEYWMAALQGGQSLVSIAKDFLNSAEYANDFGSNAQRSDARFLDDLYQMALQRQPDPGGLQTYEDALANGEPRQAVALNFILSPEAQSDLQPTFNSGVLAPDAQAWLFGSFVQNFNSAQGQVYELYEGLLGRAPDPIGFEGYVSALQGGASLNSLALDFLGSAEFTADFGEYAQLSDAQFLDDLYQTALRRQPDPGGLQYYETALANGVSRQGLALSIVMSPEAQSDLLPSLSHGVFAPNATDSEIARLYHGLLDRAPDASGLANWESAVTNGMSLTTVAQDFLNSPEYQALHGNQTDSQFVTALYQDALGIAPDPAGLAGWSLALTSGASRASVALGIIESSEAQLHLAADIELGLKLV